MKEVHLKRVAAPFKEIPFTNFIQSPIRLVPKAGSDQTRLIFHLSYEFKGDGEASKSVNACTPRKLCSVTYSDINHTVRSILILRQQELKQHAKRGGGCEEDDGVVIYFSKEMSGALLEFCRLTGGPGPGL